MHEFAAAEEILNVALRVAKDRGATKILEINVEAGELTFLNQENLTMAFETLAEKTIAEKAKLKVEVKPCRIRCHKCGYEGDVHYTGPERHEDLGLAKLATLNCPKCGKKDTEVVGGTEYFVRNIKIQQRVLRGER
jgi:hydrogenase nickel incorporation protein HypA/HybF